tara:strand:- start:1108 stop:2520 length:1413 start_codon:yes stop_codon:yes gene_type:complete
MFTNSIHWDDFTSPTQARHLKEYTIKELMQKNPYSETQTALVMSEPVDMSLNSMAGLLPGFAQEAFELTTKRIKYFRVKFLKGPNKKMSASDCIPDFAAISVTGDLFASRNKIHNLPICVAINPPDLLQVGQQVSVRTNKSDLDPDVPSMQMCSLIEVENTPIMFDDESEGGAIARSYDFLFGGQTTTLEDLRLSSGEQQFRSRAPVISTPLKITWQQALQISQARSYKKIAKWIQESEGTYDSVIGQLTGWKDPVTGKGVNQMTLAEVYTAMHGSIRRLGRTSNAVGAYQWVDNASAPSFSETVEYFKSISPDVFNESLIFNARNQDAMSVYLLFAKRPVIGQYLLGAHENHSEAAQQMAYEWASIPIQYAVRSPLGNCNKVVRRGQSAYEGCAGNRTSSRAGHSPADLVNLLQQTQKSFKRLQPIQNIASDNNIKVLDSIGSSNSMANDSQQVSEEEQLEQLKALGMA